MFERYSRDAYQIAENTPRFRHGEGCRSLGIGALVTEIPGNLCGCFVVGEEQFYLNRKYSK